MIMSAKVTAVMAAEEVRAHPGLTYLKERRIALGYSIREMAKMIGTTHGALTGFLCWQRRCAAASRSSSCRSAWKTSFICRTQMKNKNRRRCNTDGS